VIKHQTETPKAMGVADYIVQRLADEGISDCFGVPGDYAFPICDAVERNPMVKYIGCSILSPATRLLFGRAIPLFWKPAVRASAFRLSCLLMMSGWNHQFYGGLLVGRRQPPSG
jgi:hypothetical protein